MPAFTRIPTEAGPSCDLMDALHHLHLVAGHPSARDLQRDIGGRDAPSHAAIHKAFRAASRRPGGLSNRLFGRWPAGPTAMGKLR